MDHTKLVFGRTKTVFDVSIKTHLIINNIKLLEIGI